MARSPGWAFYDRHIDLLVRHDVDALIESQYHPEAVLVGFDFAVHGQAALREHFKHYLKRLGTIELVSTDQFAEIDDAIFFEATMRTALGEAVVYDVFTFQDGKAFRQFTGVKSLKPIEA